VAAIAIPLIALAFGWRSAFVFSGLLGFVWLLVWLRVYHPLDRHPRVTPGEVTYIRSGQEVPVSPLNVVPSVGFSSHEIEMYGASFLAEL